MFFYVLSLLIIIGFSSFLWSLLGLELLSWLFVIIIPETLSFIYLVIQTFFVFVAILSIIIFPFLVFWGLILKIGLPPFHGWMLTFTFIIDAIVFALLMLLHKFMPIVVFGKILSNNIQFFFVTLLILSRALLIVQFAIFFEVIFFSSIIHRGWMLLGLKVRVSFFVFYWLLYRLFLIRFFVMTKFKEILIFNLNQRGLMLLLWLIISGLPPFIIFWLKALILIVIINIKILIIRFMLLLISIINLSAYYRCFHMAISINNNLGSFEFSPILRLSLIGLIC